MRMRTTIGLSVALLIVSATAWAKQAQAVNHHHSVGIKAKPGKTAAVAAGAAAAPARSRSGGDGKPHASDLAERRDRHHHAIEKTAAVAGAYTTSSSSSISITVRALVHREAPDLPPADQYIGPVRAIGPREIGTAAWYGGRHIGERTASGERLDAVHPTAAHRSLPLHSLVRVTNLSNGRSVIAKINDRGPVSRSLLIDLSPRVAEELDMKRSGIAKVTVEPVATATTAPR